MLNEWLLIGFYEWLITLAQCWIMGKLWLIRSNNVNNGLELIDYW